MEPEKKDYPYLRRMREQEAARQRLADMQADGWAAADARRDQLAVEALAEQLRRANGAAT